ncbi:hypothetical protein C8A05DRAFT_48276 [Staphylotrichum tortipilum]|uniref:Uncharacterized protein n=1 Tax=Staphylotrichum tortipilum TaxID=2831512 RepID=A0AAN6RNE5_9PEZI|nr:hypothetical protein C8A05DRAFT_48276 [Staphylotrichum longicolle]
MTGQSSPAPAASGAPAHSAVPPPDSQQLSLAELDGEHARLLSRAISRVLSTEIAETTYAQIIDGLPTTPVAYDRRSPPSNKHPLARAHRQLCPGMLKKARAFRDDFCPDTLTFGLKVNSRLTMTPSPHGAVQPLMEYRTSAPGSRAVKTRLIELVVAEARILGGVVLFDRRNPNTTPHADPEAVYFHSDREAVTYRIYQLLSEQRNALLDFLLAEDAPSASPLPILGDENNRVRVDPEEPMRGTGVYRDLWERKAYLASAWGPGMKDVRNYLDYPTQQDQDEASIRAAWRKWKRRAADREERARRRPQT